jgi:hypothetical protein
MKNGLLFIFAESLLYGGFLIALIAGWLYGFFTVLATLTTL